MKRKHTFCALCCALLFAVALTSCNKFGSQEVPAYIHIDSITVNCDYYVYGANTSNITDAWVYVDDQIIGCYELPATFPVLEHGPHKITIYGGVCIGGIGASRAPYSFYQPAEYRDVNLVEDSIITFNPVLNYYPINEGVKVGWMEDFETTNTLVALPESDTTVQRVSAADGAWSTPNSFYSARICLPPDSLDFYVSNSEELHFHSELKGNPCLLEMDYNCNDTFFVGIMYYQNDYLSKWQMLKVLPTDNLHAKPEKWKKLYVVLGRVMTEHENADYVKVYFTSDLSLPPQYEQPPYTPNSIERYYYFDNLKLLYR